MMLVMLASFLSTEQIAQYKSPSPLTKNIFPPKFKGPGVKYKVGVCIMTGWIVWFNGPYPCGNTDLTIAQRGVCNHLEPQEKILADGGYRDGGQFFHTPTGFHNVGQRMRSLCRARHETINRRLKSFRVLSTCFQHGFEFHLNCFHVVLIVTQIHIMMYGTNFEVYYNEDIGPNNDVDFE
jgi:hypothetical protein